MTNGIYNFFFFSTLSTNWLNQLTTLLWLNALPLTYKQIYWKHGDMTWPKCYICLPISFPESSFPLTSVGKRELWEQPFQACAIDADCAVKLDGQNHQNSVISKWLLPELSFSDRWSRGTKTLGTRLSACKSLWGKKLWICLVVNYKVKVTSHLQRPKKSFFLLFDKI